MKQKKSMPKIILTVVITLLVTIVALNIIHAIPAIKYMNDHTMIYTPSKSEEELLAEEFGITLSEDVHITAAMMNVNEQVKNRSERYAIRITGADSILSFLTTNVVAAGEVTYHDQTVFVDNTPLDIHERVTNYEGTETCDGCSIFIGIMGGHSAKDNNNPYQMHVKLTFFFLNGELSYIECCSKWIPFGASSYDLIYEKYYWKDFSLYDLHRFLVWLWPW